MAKNSVSFQAWTIFLALNAIREYTESNQYDVIVHDGPGDQSSLRMWGAIGGIDWYFRRFKKGLSRLSVLSLYFTLYCTYYRCDFEQWNVGRYLEPTRDSERRKHGR